VPVLLPTVHESKWLHAPRIGCCRSRRQRYFGWTAGGLLFLQGGYSSMVLASLSLTVAQDDCQLPLRPLQWLQFFQAGWGHVTLHLCCW
jgi:hypothetical protein